MEKQTQYGMLYIKYRPQYSKLYNYHLFTETEGKSVFCGPETAVVARGEPW
jgi:hypothetical protein